MFMSINTGTPLSVAVPLLAVVVLGALSFALGTRAASGTPSRLIAGSPLDSCGDGMDNRENSGTPSAATKSEGIRGSKSHDNTESTRPTAIATWRFGSVAVAAAKISLESGGTALDALEAGINAVELDTQDQYFVGLGGLPNSEGTMEMDAAVMDGKTMTYGAVMAIRGIATPFSAARLAMEKSPHSIFAGEGATKFAISNGLKLADTLTEGARKQFEEWRVAQSHGHGTGGDVEAERERGESHDTVGMVCLDAQGNLVAGTSTSGWKFKHPGRVGDSPVVGSGLYCDSDAGGAVATGDGEEILRTCLSLLVVEFMRAGLSPTLACRKGIQRLKEIVIKNRPVEGVGVGSGEDSKEDQMYERLTVAVVAMSPSGEVGAASTLGPENVHRGRPVFPFAIWREGEDARVVEEDELPLPGT